MRKMTIPPLLAVGGGVVGALLRRWELDTAFEANTGLPIWGQPATIALIGLTILVAAALLVFLRCTKTSRFPDGYDQAFQSNAFWYIAPVITAGMLLVVEAGVILFQIIAGKETGIFQILLMVLAALTAVSILKIGHNNYRDEKRGKYSITLLVPAFFCCFWLILVYRDCAADPVILDYIYELFAIISAVLALYFTAGFGFEKSKMRRVAFFSFMAVYFCLITLANTHSLADLIIYIFIILYLLPSATVLLVNNQKNVLEVGNEKEKQDG